MTKLIRLILNRLNAHAFIIVFLALSMNVIASPRNDFSLLLNEHVNDGVVNYAGFDNNPSFDAYINHIANIEITEDMSREEKLSFYLNAYNALSIKGILDGYSPSSFFGKITYFYRVKYKIAGETMNLYDFEHEVIRKLGEPRIHFALVCASASCPKLRSEAYNPNDLDQQLNENAIDFINDKEKNVFDVTTRKAKISKIFSWFKEDFIEKTSLQVYISQFVEDQEVKSLLEQEDFRIKHKKYDWSLNGTK